MNFISAIRTLLAREDYPALVLMAREHGGRTAAGLIGLVTDPDETIKWRAVTALGRTVAAIYSRDPERARRVIRQLLWNLNQESGGIGWGMPEAFGEIIALTPSLKREYGFLLVAYLSEKCCFLENDQLVLGVVWALGRIRDLEPELKQQALPFLLEALCLPNPTLQGTAAWTLGQLKAVEALPLLKTLRTEAEMIKIFEQGSLKEKTSREWIMESIEKIEGEVKTMQKDDWRCSKCGYTLKAVEAPPEKCPACNEKCEFVNVTCYIPECGFSGSDERLK
jgi:rubredoxin